MKKSLIALALATAASSSMASDQITDVRFSKYSASQLEVFFTRPANWNGQGSCQVQIREASYPNTIYTAQQSTNLHAGAPVDLSENQYANFSVPSTYRGIKKQVRILCDTANGQVQSTSTIPAPPTVNVNLQAAETSADVYNVTGGIYVEGNAAGTSCRTADEQSSLHGKFLFTDEFGSASNYWANHYSVQENLSGFYYGYAQTQFECSSEGGTTVMLVEFQQGVNNELEISSEAIYYK